MQYCVRFEKKWLLPLSLLVAANVPVSYAGSCPDYLPLSELETGTVLKLIQPLELDPSELKDAKNQSFDDQFYSTSIIGGEVHSLRGALDLFEPSLRNSVSISFFKSGAPDKAAFQAGKIAPFECKLWAAEKPKPDEKRIDSGFHFKEPCPMSTFEFSPSVLNGILPSAPTLGDLRAALSPAFGIIPVCLASRKAGPSVTTQSIKVLPTEPPSWISTQPSVQTPGSRNEVPAK